MSGTIDVRHRDDVAFARRDAEVSSARQALLGELIGEIPAAKTQMEKALATERDLDVFTRISREREGCLAVGALVARPGTVMVGDALTPHC